MLPRSFLMDLSVNSTQMDFSSIPVKDDFQSVLRTIESLFVFFCFVSCKTAHVQNGNISQLLTWRQFKVSKQPPLWSKLYASFFLISFDETTSQLYKSMKLLEKEFERHQRKGMWFVTNNIDSYSIENLQCLRCL